jgi:tetratricopeptide (TPR) repeat protein
LIAYAGDWDRGCALTERARSLSPHHPGWYWFPPFFDAYRKSDYRSALDIALKINMPGFWRSHFALAVAQGQLGEREAASNPLRALLALRPDFAASGRAELRKWFQPELVEHLIDGLRKAGLDVPAGPGGPPEEALARLARKAEEAVAIAVLPFSDMSPAKDQEYLCEGMAEEVMNALVRAFQEAVRLDPTHAPSWTGLAESLALSAHMSLIPAHEACAAARKALSTALELQGESADGLHGEAFVAFIERRWKALEAAVRRAIELQPAHVPSLGMLGMCLSLHQKPDAAEPFFERARQADPLASFPYMLTALGLLTVRRPQEAHRYAEQALTFEKEDASALFCSSLANVALGRLEEGIAAAERGVAVSHRGADFLGLLGWALATAGRKDEAQTFLDELRARPEDTPPIVSAGWLLGALGKIDAAFEVLVRAESSPGRPPGSRCSWRGWGCPFHQYDSWCQCWYNDPMQAKRKVTIEVPADLLKRARRSTGEGITATVRRGLELVAARSAYEELRRLRGAVRLEVDVEALRQDRR